MPEMSLKIRIGINSGPVTAGIVGTKVKSIKNLHMTVNIMFIDATILRFRRYCKYCSKNGINIKAISDSCFGEIGKFNSAELPGIQFERTGCD